MNKPKFVLDVEKNTGLACRFLRQYKSGFSDWELLSPTGFPILEIGGRDGDIGSVGHISNMRKLQGKK